MHAPLQEKPKVKTWLQKILRAEYFVIALLVHVLILLSFGGKVLFDAVTQESVLKPGSIIVDGGELGPPPPPPPLSSTQLDEVPEDVVVKTPPNTNDTEVIANALMNPDFNFAPPTITTPRLELLTNPGKPATPAPPKTNSFSQRAPSVREFTKDWGPGGSGAVSSGTGTQATFTCFIAKGGGIDPANSHELDPKTGEIQAGCIPNLLHMINAWSKGKIKAEGVPVPLDLASQVIFEKKPPFIYLAGYGDFKLTTAEIANLKKYLMMGGAIWGDSGLAGVGSKFDIAFRREMKLVIPDVDKPFEPLPPTHPIYSGDKAFFQLKGQPPGMNFRNDPTEVIKIDDEIAVIYTPNNYTDLMQAGFARPVKASNNVYPKDVGRGWKEAYPWMTLRQRVMLHPQNIYYFDNFTIPASEKAFQFGINIIVHLITRFQEKLLLAP